MELSLNVLWVLIALGALGVWRHEWKREKRPKPRLQEWTAFVCALVFLFFAVSLSDDLHAEAIVADDCAGGRHHSLIRECGHQAHQVMASTRALPAGVLPRAVLSTPGPVFALITPLVVEFAGAPEFEFTATRAPPLLSS